jgi:hypothetical protein
MKRTVTEYEFVKAFDDYGRETNFTRLGRFALYEYLTDLEEDCGIELELDVIGICCDFTEYESLDDCNEQTGYAYRDMDEVAADSLVVTGYDGERFIAQDF